MITYIKGELADVTRDSVVLECHGIGYEILVPGSVLSELPQVGEAVKMYTYMNVREDGVTLFGFLSKDEQAMFKLLITVNGVGPKGALGILSVMSADGLRMAILAEDEKAISKAPGIGAKTAKKMIIELKDKIDLSSFSEGFGQTKNMTIPVSNSNVSEATAALAALGYSQTEALQAVRSVENSEAMSVEELLKQALKSMKMF